MRLIYFTMVFRFKSGHSSIFSENLRALQSQCLFSIHRLLTEVEVLLDMDEKDKEGSDLGKPDGAEVPQKKVV